jgi:hypothetical protein
LSSLESRSIWQEKQSEDSIFQTHGKGGLTEPIESELTVPPRQLLKNGVIGQEHVNCFSVKDVDNAEGNENRERRTGVGKVQARMETWKERNREKENGKKKENGE